MEIAINANRLHAEMSEQGKIGWRDNVGLERAAYSPAYAAARDYLRDKMAAAGLETRLDRVGNLFGRLAGSDAAAPTILIGSHLDAVEGGGIYDGAYGIFAGLEAVRAIRESGVSLRHGLEVVAFTAEEGGPLGGTFGSRCFCGMVKEPPPDSVLRACGLSAADLEAAAADTGAYCCYLEPHIEQGPVLDRHGPAVGFPTAIVGLARYRCLLTGEANHAGTTPMPERRDAFYESISLLHRWIDWVRQTPDTVCNVAELTQEPGQIGVVAGRMGFSVEIRARREADIAAAAAELQSALAACKTCQSEMVLTVMKPPARLDKRLIRIMEETAAAMGVETRRMLSGASHDASPLSKVMPAAMLFVPSVSGISHSKDEYTRPEHLAAGARLLANSLLRLDGMR